MKRCIRADEFGDREPAAAAQPLFIKL